MINTASSVNSLLIIPLLSLIAGISTQAHIGCSLSWGVGLSAGTLGMILLINIMRRPTNSESLVLQNSVYLLLKYKNIGALFFCVGLIILPLQRNHIDHLRQHYTNKPLTIIAQVTDVQTSPGSLFEGVAQVTVKELKQPEDTQYEQVHFSFLCYNKQVFDLEVGDEVFFENITLPLPSSSSLAQNTSFGDYLIKENITAAVFLQKNDVMSVTGKTKFSVNKWIWQQKMRVLKTIKKHVSPLAYSYFALIFLGYKQLAQNHELRKVFNLWGLAHFLARAGLHIMLFIWLWQLFLGFLPLPITLKRIILFCVCFTYALFSWSSIPFFRAYVVFALARIAHFLDQQTNFLHLLSITCLFVLLLNPMQLFFLDFQLTFALTFVLGWFSQINTANYTKKIW